MRARPHAQAHVRMRQVELGEEHVRQERVVVLSGVDEPLLEARPGSAAMTGAALMKFGRAPTTWRSSGIAGRMPCANCYSRSP